MPEKTQENQQTPGEVKYMAEKPNCSHLGNFSPPVQQVIVLPSVGGFIICSVSCQNCGQIFTNVSALPIGQSSPIAIPKMVSIGKN